MSQHAPEIIFGAASFGNSSGSMVKQSTVQEVQAVLDVLKKQGIKNIDTSRNYPVGAEGSSEELLGQTDAPSWAVFGTKVRSRPGDHSAAGIEESITGSLEALKISKIHIEYLHWPDRTIPLEETLKAMNTAHAAGKFEQLGISNYTIREVEQIVQICKTNGYVLPSVYQGRYNPIARRAEDKLLPLLREHNIKFYAWSPAAGGAFNDANTRVNSKGPVQAIVKSMYGSEGTLAAVANVVEIAAKHDIPGHEAALRWVLHHSALDAAKGDAMIVGASSVQQLENTLMVCKKGPLPKEVVDGMEEVWKQSLPSAPSYSPWAPVDEDSEDVNLSW